MLGVAVAAVEVGAAGVFGAANAMVRVGVDGAADVDLFDVDVFVVFHVHSTPW